MLVLVDPEWAPLLNGMSVASTPITVHGTVQGMHGDTSGDFPATHVRADVNHFVVLDPADVDRLATGNDDGELHFEWEAGTYPAWAWAGAGDRVVGIGRWIFDCGHPGAQPGHRPVAPSTGRDLAFNLPMPPRPVGGRPRWRIIPLPAPGGTAARVRVHRRLRDPQPHLHVIVRMTRRVHHMRPTGYAGTIVAGWRNDPTPLKHGRVTVSGLVVNNALPLANPVAPQTGARHDNPRNTAGDCPSGDSCLGVGPVKSWVMQAAINGEWQELTGPGIVNPSDVVPQALAYDQYPPATGEAHLQGAGAAHHGLETRHWELVGTDLAAAGF